MHVLTIVHGIIGVRALSLFLLLSAEQLSLDAILFTTCYHRLFQFLLWLVLHFCNCIAKTEVALLGYIRTGLEIFTQK